MGSAKPFGILIEGYRGRGHADPVIAVIGRSGDRKPRDGSGMGRHKCCGILVGGYRGGAGSSLYIDKAVDG